MPSDSQHSAPLLRKQMLGILHDRLLPSLRLGRGPLVIRGGLPLQHPPEIRRTSMPTRPLKPEDAADSYPDGFVWEEARMHHLQYPVLRCVYEGEAVLRFGVTDVMSRDRPAGEPECGGYAFHVPAVAYMLVPAGVPMPTGDLPPWEEGDPSPPAMGLVQLRFLPAGVLCNLNEVRDGQHHIGYSLFVQEPVLRSCLEILELELRAGAPDAEILRAQLLVLLLKLEQSLRKEIPAMTDGLHSRFPFGAPEVLSSVATEPAPLAAIARYVSLHLHEELNPELLANQIALSARQLNRLMRTHRGQSTMRYVRSRRIETARLLLRRTMMPVSEISRLVGYADLAHFSRDFKTESGVSPLKFRQTSPSAAQSK